MSCFAWINKGFINIIYAQKAKVSYLKREPHYKDRGFMNPGSTSSIAFATGIFMLSLLGSLFFGGDGDAKSLGAPDRCGQHKWSSNLVAD